MEICEKRVRTQVPFDALVEELGKLGHKHATLLKIFTSASQI